MGWSNRVRVMSVAVLALAGAVLVAWGWNTTNARAADVAVSMNNFAFSPASTTIAVGDRVVWTNNQAGIPHTATSDAGVSPAFDTGNLASGASGAVTFSTAGTFAYHCTIHPNMTGTVVVTAASAASPTAAASPTTGGAASPTAAGGGAATATRTATTAPAAPAAGTGTASGSAFPAQALFGAGAVLLLAATGLAVMGRRSRS